MTDGQAEGAGIRSDETASVLAEASRELAAATHDAQVAFDCIALGALDRAHTNALTARTAVDAAVAALEAALTELGGTTGH